MQKFIKMTGIAASMPMSNIDTDMIIPKQFLKTIHRTGLGTHLFNDMRYKADGTEISDFILNQKPYRHTSVLVAGDNFGCGSSREHAPWALLDFGIRCVIAPSFADIFYNNCFKNGILPLSLPKDDVAVLSELAKKEGTEITIDLEQLTISCYPHNAHFTFKLDPFRRHCLLNGLDDIGLTETKGTEIMDFETKRKTDYPWL